MHNTSYAEVFKNSTVLKFTLIFPSTVALRIYVVYVTSIWSENYSWHLPNTSLHFPLYFNNLVNTF